MAAERAANMPDYPDPPEEAAEREATAAWAAVLQAPVLADLQS